MIEMGRFDDALQLEAQAEHVGVLPDPNAFIADYLAGKEDAVTERANAMQFAFAGTTTANGAPITHAELYEYGLYLDAIGKIGAGSELWRVSAAVAGGVPELASTQASMLAQAALGQMPAAVLDFQIVQAHRSSSLLLSGDIYPMAEFGIARAYGASRDKADSVEAYRRFLMLWKEADRGQPLLVEALAKSK